MRNDEQVRDDILAELKWDPEVEADRVRVVVHQGIATLTGNLASTVQRYAVERAAKRVCDPKALDFHMVVLSAPNYNAVAEGTAAAIGRPTPVLPSPFSDTLARLMNMRRDVRRTQVPAR